MKARFHTHTHTQVEHAAQLPRAIAERFRASAVSGYDFAELVRDDSATGALSVELGVEQPRHRECPRALRFFSPSCQNRISRERVSRRDSLSLGNAPVFRYEAFPPLRCANGFYF